MAISFFSKRRKKIRYPEEKIRLKNRPIWWRFSGTAGRFSRDLTSFVSSSSGGGSFDKVAIRTAPPQEPTELTQPEQVKVVSLCDQCGGGYLIFVIPISSGHLKKIRNQRPISSGYLKISGIKKEPMRGGRGI